MAGWVFVTGLVGFVMMGTDKVRAGHQSRRVPEKTFMKVSAIGGFAGVLLGISVFRHKINKPGFVLPIVGITLVWLYLLSKATMMLLCLNTGK